MDKSEITVLWERQKSYLVTGDKVSGSQRKDSPSLGLRIDPVEDRHTGALSVQ